MMIRITTIVTTIEVARNVPVIVEREELRPGAYASEDPEFAEAMWAAWRDTPARGVDET